MHFLKGFTYLGTGLFFNRQALPDRSILSDMTLFSDHFNEEARKKLLPQSQPRSLPPSTGFKHAPSLPVEEASPRALPKEIDEAEWGAMLQIDGKKSKGAGWIGPVAFGVIVLLLLGGPFLLIMREQLPSGKKSTSVAPTSVPQIHPLDTLSLQAMAKTFTQDLQGGRQSIQRAHDQLYQYVRKNPNAPMQAAAWRVSDGGAALPTDYEAFFTQTLAGFAQTPPPSGPFKDSTILLSLSSQNRYRLQWVVNWQHYSIPNLPSVIPDAGQVHQWVATGTYTSPFHVPVGLSAARGRIANPAIRDMEGLVVITPNGRWKIDHIDHLEYGLQPYRIRQSREDYLAFLSAIEQDQLSVFQSHLLVYEGVVQVPATADPARARRRVLFQTGRADLHVFDSKSEALTLREAALRVKERFGADRAVNLDMGTFNYCMKKEGIQPISYSHLPDQGVIISNFLVVWYE